MLQELHFLESDLTLVFFDFLLQCPKSLKALTIINNSDYRLIENHDLLSTEEYINSMVEVASTVEYFRLHDHRACINGAVIGIAFILCFTGNWYPY